MPENSVISFRNLSFVYASGLRALSDIHLDIHEGEFVSLLGPSGCGKSTVLRLAAGLLPAPSAAQIHARRDAMSYVFQNPTLMPWASVERNVRLPLELQGEHDSAANNIRLDDTLRKVGLQDFRRAYPHELSGGMQMRVSIARALVTQPRLLLMDEPFAALDEITRNRLDTDLLALHAAQKLTVLFVTHSIYEAVFLSTRIVVMSTRPGRIVGELSIDEASDATRLRGDAFRNSERFARYCAQVSRMLSDAATVEPA